MSRRLAFLWLLAALTLPAQAQTTVEYIHTDALGSPVAVTDASRNVIERSEYEPFGKVLVPASPADGIGYTGHVLDAATGLNYMQQRYYDPQIGRFLSVDPVTAYEKPLTNFNRYVYALNNPYKFTDPDGREAACEASGCPGPGTTDSPIKAAYVALAAWLAHAITPDNSGDSTNGAAEPQGEADQGPSSPGNEGSHQSPDFTDVEGSPGRFGEPGSTTRGEMKSRTYRGDGAPKTDVELGHPDEKGVGNGPHAHDWADDGSGNPPRHTDRGPPRPIQDGDPPMPRGPNVRPPGA